MSFRHIPGSRTAGSHGSSILNSFEKPPYCFPQWLHQFTFLPVVHTNSLFLTSSPVLLSCLFYYNHSNRCEVISHWICIFWWLVLSTFYFWAQDSFPLVFVSIFMLVPCGLNTICRRLVASYVSCWFFVTLWSVACQAPLSMGFPRQEYWSGLPFPSPCSKQILYQLHN